MNDDRQLDTCSLKRALIGLAVLLAALQIWADPFRLSSDDIIAYLDIGDAYMQGRWRDAINAYWSPLYSLLLGLTFSVVRPSAYWEFAAVRLVNFLIFLAALGCFGWFLNELIRFHEAKVSRQNAEVVRAIPPYAWHAMGYSFFTWLALYWIDVRCDTPDMAVFALALSASAMTLRIYARPTEQRYYLALGVVLALGCLAKSVMFPIALVYLAVVCFVALKNRKIIPFAVAVIIICLLTAPFIAALSLQKNRFTFSETGRLAYRWVVIGDTPFRHGQGQMYEGDAFLHPTQLVFKNPEVYTFSAPFSATYPPWHDPSYWYDGIASRFIWANQRWILEKNATYYSRSFLAALAFGYILLVFLSEREKQGLRELVANYILLLPAAAGLFAYMVVTDVGANPQMPHQLHSRYIAPFVLLLYAGVFSSVSLPRSVFSERLMKGLVLGVVAILGVKLAYGASTDLRQILRRSEPHTQWEVYTKIKELGIKAGERVAILGKYGPDYHWARLARVAIVAEIPRAEDFWTANDDDRRLALRRVGETGAKLIVQSSASAVEPVQSSADGWLPIGHGYKVHLFR